ncbi:hypothetical protein [Actinoplanes teichomyceticus]|uniref:Uncharacterized protein n=1 Tax=Actinoplanes teichomyceticus TaxID=1867 RepID=A0A561VMN6_ACTTI|nr:hypothetical protein [Actinoplanes teichomyceticus]TWG12881.1 hypothetical protein FHX34_105749 [Actinoplanes teichomyceticus]GIF13630.1 hypothetical protein Ate01nite_36620 [Actinoplanes teichomyceticus]
MTLEEELRTTLRDRAAVPAPQPELWATVAAAVHRDRRRRRVVAVGAVVAVIAAGAAAPVLRHQRTDPRPAVPATTTTSAAPGWPTPVFPLRPTWMPPGLDTYPFVAQMGPNRRLEYRNADGSVLATEVGPLQADWETEAERVYTARVHGRDAEVHVAQTYDGADAGERFAGVRWRLADGRWVSVLSWGERSDADVLRFARGLAGGHIAAREPVPYTLPFVPAGLVPQTWSDTVLCLAPPRIAAAERRPDGLCFDLTDDAGFDPASATESWTVDGRRVAYEPDAAGLVVEWGGDSQITVNWDPRQIRLRHDEVVRLAAGIRPARR